MFTSIELFAGAGGIALGLEKAGFKNIALNEIDKHAVNTLRINRPNWNIIHGDIRDIDFKEFEGKVNLLTGGFPCQSFSYAGKRLGFEDIRGTMFFEFMRVAKQVLPEILMIENVKGLEKHDGGKTLKTILEVVEDSGYSVIGPKVMNAAYHSVPQKRERLFIIGIRNDIVTYKPIFQFPKRGEKMFTIKEFLKKGEFYSVDTPKSIGMAYPKRKAEILDLVPPGGYWRNLPLEIQKEYMKGSFYLGGGKTGMARRISWDEPSLTLTCSPSQNQTERCHPEETRPFTVREYARIQTFPDDWFFCGPMGQQYKQIGNAVPVNLAYEMGKSLYNFLEFVHTKKTTKKIDFIYDKISVCENTI